jgi:hypothetical protein
VASHRATTVKQGARFGERRLIGDVAAFALPSGVPTAGTRHASDEHVSRQQPVAPHTAVRSFVHLFPPMEPTRSSTSIITSITLASLVSRIQGGCRIVMVWFPAAGVSLS